MRFFTDMITSTTGNLLNYLPPDPGLTLPWLDTTLITD